MNTDAGSRPLVAGVILAAGASTRMGRPKARLIWRGRTFLEHAHALATVAACDPIVVVTGACELDDIALGDAVLAHNTGWRDGQLSSLQTGIRAAFTDRHVHAGVLVLTIDRPRVAATTIVELRRHIDDDPDRVWQPRVHGRSGHPIYYPAEVANRLLTWPPESTPRELLAQPDIASRRAFVDVDDPGVQENIDTPTQLRTLAE